MAGDTLNARHWAEADVLVNFDPETANIPADADEAFDGDWEIVGLLDGGQGFAESVSETTTPTYAWGKILIANIRSDFLLTRTFTAYEENDTTQRLLWPGSTLGSGTLKVPQLERVKIAFETRDPSRGVTRRLISYQDAEVGRNGDVSEIETAPSTIPFIATIFPDADGNLWTLQETEEGS